MPICIFSQKRGPCQSSFYAMLQWHFYLCFLRSLTNWQQGHGGISQCTFSKPLWQIDMRDICCFHREMCFQDVGIHAELMIYHLQRLVGLNFASDVFEPQRNNLYWETPWSFTAKNELYTLPFFSDCSCPFVSSLIFLLFETFCRTLGIVSSRFNINFWSTFLFLGSSFLCSPWFLSAFSLLPLFLSSSLQQLFIFPSVFSFFASFGPFL